MSKTAIILGATGLTGSYLLKRLIPDKRYGKIILFSRSATAIRSSKIEEHLIDLFELGRHRDKFKADVVFCCIGTTQNKTPNKEIYRKVDYGIPVTAAKLCAENKIENFLVISALGADPKSRFFYNQTKGEMEKAVLQQEIRNTFIFQPSLIGGERQEKRPLEFISKQLMKAANFVMFGPLKKYQSIHPDSIAKAMQKVAVDGYEKIRIESDEIKKLAKDHD
ncbi:MAG TPA: NAD-dependent epimerase/dehydratase family protein [Salegentibacter sp.]|uniref:NAD-dependent epimerase/dehydratase family protein n=1 Tax=Salegentibacter sp. TaxID=1903072 RepID=UPI002F92DFFC